MEINHTAQINMGWSSQILILNGEIVVKIPRKDEYAEYIEKEILVTNALRDILPVEVPEYIARVGESILEAAAYKLIHGAMFTTQPVSQEVLKIDPSEYFKFTDTKTVSSQIGKILSEIHSVGRDIIGDNLEKYVKDTWNEKMASWFLRCDNVCKGGFSGDEGTQCMQFLEAIKRKFNELQFEEKFIHGDFGGWNILFDPKEGKIKGIIDWADSRIGDPAKDFTELIYDFGEPFAKEVLQYYGNTDPGIIDRASYYLKLAGFQDLEYGLETGDGYFINRGYESIRKELKNFQSRF